MSGRSRCSTSWNTPRRWPGRTASDRWTAAGALWSSRSPSPTRTTDDDTLEEARATHGMAQPGRPAAIASNGVDRGGQCCNRVGIKARAIEPRTAAPSGLTRWWQREQGGIAPDLADDLMAEAQGGADQRAAHGPGVEQQTDWTQSTDRA